MARRIAGQLREATGGLPAVRALGLKLDEERTQVSMNLVDYRRTDVATAHAWVERLATQPVVDGDRLSGNPRPLLWEDVTADRTIGDGTFELQILTVEASEHADGVLTVHVPRADLMFVSDLVTPTRVDAYPRENHAALDRAFVAWLDSRGLAPTRILAMHGSGELTPAHLQKLRR